MKTKQFTLAAIMMILFYVSGYSETPTLSIFDINGVTVEIPIKLEEASDSIPPEISSALADVRACERRSLYTRQFDLSLLSRPEKDADDVCIDTRAIFQTIMRSNTKLNQTTCK